MAEHSISDAKMARILAVIQINIGVLLLCFGIADRLVRETFYTGNGYFGVWSGIWMCITGCLGIPGSGRERTSSRNAFAGVFMGFSITSAVFGGIIIIVYSIGISWLTRWERYSWEYYDGKYHKVYYEDFPRKLAILAFMLLLGIATFLIGIWAAICSCFMEPCCKQPQEEQRMYHNNPADRYDIHQLSEGLPVPTPMQLGGGAAAQGSHRPVVLGPVSGALAGQDVVVPAASSEGMATGTPQEQFQPHLVHISPPNAISNRDSSPLLKNEEISDTSELIATTSCAESVYK